MPQMSNRRRACAPADRHVRPLAEGLEGRVLLATTLVGRGEQIYVFNNPTTPTPARIYPSVMNVSGIGSPVTELRVTLSGFQHERPQDIDILLRAPNGRTVIVMSDAGGTAAMTEMANLSFADNATKDLPQNTAPIGSTYRPTNFGAGDFFPPEAPAIAPSHTRLNDIVGTPNGEWKLFVVDDTFGSEGGLAGGWALTFTTGGPGPAAPSTPDLHPAFDRGTSNEDNVTNTDTPVFVGTAPAGATKVRLFHGGIPGGEAEVVDGQYQVQGDFLPQGTYEITARSLNASGTEGPESGAILVTIDLEVPEMPSIPDLTAASDTGASNTDDITTDTTPTFTGTVLGGASTVTLVANDQVIGTGTVTGTTYTATVAPPLAPGNYSVQVFAHDLAGNASSITFAGLPITIEPGGTPTAAIEGIWVRGQTWVGNDNNPANTTFLEYMQSLGQGDVRYGFTLPATAPTNADTVSWINADEIVVRYDNPADPPSGVTIDGVRHDYAASQVTAIDNRTYVIRLDRPLGNIPGGGVDGDRVTVTIPGGGPNGTPYVYRLNVLQGDANRDALGRVNAADQGYVKSRLNRTTNAPGTGAQALYTVFADVNADGRVNAVDQGAVKSRANDGMPAAVAAAARFGATRIADEVLA